MNVVGKRIPRVDGPKKTKGEARYTADIELPQMLAGKILRSPLPHAKILHVDTSKAARLPGVKEVISGKDTLGLRYGVFYQFPPMVDRYGLAIDKVRYIGDEVAAVAAADEDTAEEALDLIEVDYEPLPPVFDPMKAMEPDAPKIHDHVENNILSTLNMNFGDVDEGFARSDYVREDRFTTPNDAHSPMEPHAALASYDPSGKLCLWTSKQDLYFVHRDLARLLGIPQAQIRVIKPFVGGGFGGKIDLFSSDFCASLLSMKTGRPVKIIYTREESLLTTVQRHAMMMRIKTGVKKDGTFMARECELIADGGAYSSTGPIAVYIAGTLFVSTFPCPNVRFKGTRVYTNKPPCGPKRGHGGVQPRFADDSHLDMLARDLGMDILELMKKNAPKAGDVTPCGLVYNSCGLKECLDKAAEAIGWREKRGKKRDSMGVGLGSSAFVSGANVDPNHVFSPIVKINYDGSVTLITGATEIGQGCETILSQIVAEELGLRMEDVSLISADTELAPVEPGSYSSRVTFISGNAVLSAAQEVKKELFKVAAEKLEANPEDLMAADRKIWVRGSPERGMGFDEIMDICRSQANLPIVKRGYFKPKAILPNVWTGEGNWSQAYSFGAQGAEVEVDRETGKVKVLRMKGAHDCGRAINPMAVEGQLEGSSVGGMGFALFEQFLQAEGLAMNPGLLDYKMPTSMDIPDIEHVIVETVDPEGPYGAKEAGEGTQISPSPAIANAIYDATGIRIFDLPITPEKIIEALGS